MNLLPIHTFFYMDDKKESLITSLRSITSLCLLYEKIIPLSSISLSSLGVRNKKIVELKEKKNGDIFYIEHPLSFRMIYSLEKSKWDYKSWMEWLEECISILTYYPEIHIKVNRFFEKEVKEKLGVSKYQIKYLTDKVYGLEESMIIPFFQYHYELEGKTFIELNKIDWNSMLGGHVDAMSVLYRQISSEQKRTNIILNVFKIIKIFSPLLEKNFHHKKKMDELVLDFKKEVNKVIQNEVSFVETKKIHFRDWFLSLSQFFLYCKPISFDIKESLFRFNLILYLAFNEDELYKTNKISYLENNFLKKISNEKIKEIHPFMRNVYYKNYL